MGNEQDGRLTPQQRLNVGDSLLMGFGLMALFEGYRIMPETPSGALLVVGVGLLLFGGIRFFTRWWRKIHAE